MTFTEAQVKDLDSKLNAKHVRTRRARDTVLKYVEGWHVIAEANRIFGYERDSFEGVGSGPETVRDIVPRKSCAKMPLS